MNGVAGVEASRPIGAREAAEPLESGAATDRPPRPRLLIGLVASVLVLVTAFVLSLGFGAASISAPVVLDSLLAYDGSVDHLTVRTLRLPRGLLAVAVGASLGVAGAVMQGVTRNPLASPGLLGLNAGAAFAVVLVIALVGPVTAAGAAGLAFAGAGLTVVIGYLLASTGRGGLASVRVVIAGAALGLLFTSLTTAILVYDAQALEQIRFWIAGSVAGRDLEILEQVLPFLVAGLALSVMLGKQITTLSLGDAVAVGLGQRTGMVRLAAAVAVLLLAGGAVAAAGPIGFVGLVAPNVVRSLIGHDYRWVVPYSAVGGALLLLAADVAGRLAFRPLELPVGVMTAVVGGPVLIHLARREGAR